MFPLKPISPDAIPHALAKAERYRLLNEPREAESICLDILQIEPNHQEALVVLLLSLTDQFAARRGVGPTQAEEVILRLQSEFESAYYNGVICERWAKAQLDADTPGHVVYNWLLRAMDWYEKAEAISPAGNDDAILRWNACVRMMRRSKHVRPYEPEVALADDFGMGFSD